MSNAPSYVETTPDYSTLLRLDGRHVVVLGAGQGIGRQTAIAAAQLGAHVTCIDANAERGGQVASEIGGRALVCDITQRTALEQAIQSAVQAFGPVHGMVDIVGMAVRHPLAVFDDESWQQAFDMNLRHAFLAVQLGSAAMTDGGSIVLIASVAGLRSSPGNAAYGAAKAGIVNLAASATVEYGPAGIRVNVVAPGQTRTPRMSGVHAAPGYYEERAKSVPLRRVGEPRDIASGVVFFLSDLAQWISGQTLVVDGGTGCNYQYPTE